MSRTPKDHVHQGKHGRNDRCAPASPTRTPSQRPPVLRTPRPFSERRPANASAMASGKPPRRPNFITRSVNRWCNRLLGAVSERSLTGQEAEYAAHRTTRDYVWNTVGVERGAWCSPSSPSWSRSLRVWSRRACSRSRSSPPSCSCSWATTAYAPTSASDLDEEHSFADYQANRWITCALMLAAGAAYCSIRGYAGDMLVISGGVYVYKMIDALADVYEGVCSKPTSCTWPASRKRSAR